MFNQDRRAARRTAAAATVLAGLAGATFTAAHPASASTLIDRIASLVTCGTTKACVAGTNTSSGPGVAGSSKSGVGVSGYSVSDAGVYGSSSSGLGVYSVSGGSAVYGISLSDAGVAGYSSSVTGVQGFTDTGVAGVFQSGGVNAVTVANTNATNPFTANAFTATIVGDSNDLVNDTRAVMGVNQNGDGADFSGSYIGIVGRAPAAGYPMDLVTPNGDDLVLVDGAGNALISGNLTVDGTINGNLQVPGGRHASAFVAKMAAPTVEDTGSAQLTNGSAAVRLDPTFAASVDVGQSYRVFLTPDGDTNGLYVAAKTPRGFIVREIHGGRSTLGFDYRIVATAFGDAGKRSALLAPGRRPKKVLALAAPQPRKLTHPAIPAAFATR
jgi:hypothetical protein